MSKPSWMHGTHASSKLLAPIIGLSLATIATAIYLSPGGSPSIGGQRAAAATPTTSQSGPAPLPSNSRAAAAVGKKPKPTSSPTPRPGTTEIIRSTTVELMPGTTKTVTSAISTHVPRCSDFKWQQDAQAAYVANLSDPYGLDGAPGPNNGDGLACTELPVDPSRAPSIPVDAFGGPEIPQKAALLRPERDYFGVAEDGVPGDVPLLKSVATAAGKAPSSLEWFSYWDSGFDATKVDDAWDADALPVITWMSEASDNTAPNASTYTLANIVAGKFDPYLLQYAGAVLKTGLPVAIRLDHEMNGDWYPWSAGLPANQPAKSDPDQANLYVQAWQHVWNVFNSVGANSDVIWLWTPSRVDTITPGSKVSGFKYETSLAQDYPGDQYVDWVGTSAYEYKPTDAWTYSGTFAKTIAALKSVTSKPIFIAETGATETVGSTDYSALKAQWTRQTLAGFLDDPSIVGFSWFNNTVNDVHTVDGQAIQTDWQFTSSNPADSAFRAGVSNPKYASGLMPDGSGE
ncbi:MAG TPA: glycosyl hydrolase [Jatrophihabitantaceae bacterium]|nr:glycosyl hydrolase [Jatrophihabitantaceae bacterium]